MTVRAIDWSEWTGPIDTSFFERIQVEHNIKGIIPQLWGGGMNAGRKNDYFHSALDLALKAGLKCYGAYVWPPSDWARAVYFAGSAMADIPILWLDVEAGAGVSQGMFDGLDAAGIKSGIYASPGSWSAIMNNTLRFADRPLWVARYPRDLHPADIIVWESDLARALAGYRMGGWVEPVAWQFRGTTYLGPESADLMILDETYFGKERKKDMTLVAAVVPNYGYSVFVTNGLRKRWVTNKAEADMWALVLGPPASVTPEAIASVPDDKELGGGAGSFEGRLQLIGTMTAF